MGIPLYENSESPDTSLPSYLIRRELIFRLWSIITDYQGSRPIIMDQEERLPANDFDVNEYCVETRGKLLEFIEETSQANYLPSKIRETLERLEILEISEALEESAPSSIPLSYFVNLRKLIVEDYTLALRQSWYAGFLRKLQALVIQRHRPVRLHQPQPGADANWQSDQQLDVEKQGIERLRLYEIEQKEALLRQLEADARPFVAPAIEFIRRQVLIRDQPQIYEHHLIAIIDNIEKALNNTGVSLQVSRPNFELLSIDEMVEKMVDQERAVLHLELSLTVGAQSDAPRSRIAAYVRKIRRCVAFLNLTSESPLLGRDSDTLDPTKSPFYRITGGDSPEQIIQLLQEVEDMYPAHQANSETWPFDYGSVYEHLILLRAEDKHPTRLL